MSASTQSEHVDVAPGVTADPLFGGQDFAAIDPQNYRGNLAQDASLVTSSMATGGLMSRGLGEGMSMGDVTDTFYRSSNLASPGFEPELKVATDSPPPEKPSLPDHTEQNQATDDALADLTAGVAADNPDFDKTAAARELLHNYEVGVATGDAASIGLAGEISENYGMTPEQAREHLAARSAQITGNKGEFPPPPDVTAAVKTGPRLGERALALAGGHGALAGAFALRGGAGVLGGAILGLGAMMNPEFRSTLSTLLRSGGVAENQPPSPPRTFFLPVVDANDGRNRDIMSTDDRITRYNAEITNYDPSDKQLWDNENTQVPAMTRMMSITDSVNGVTEKINGMLDTYQTMMGRDSQSVWLQDLNQAIQPQITMLSSFGDEAGKPLIDSTTAAAGTADGMYQSIREANAQSRTAIAQSQGKVLGIFGNAGFGDEAKLTDKGDDIRAKMQAYGPQVYAVRDSVNKWAEGISNIAPGQKKEVDLTPLVEGIRKGVHEQGNPPNLEPAPGKPGKDAGGSGAPVGRAPATPPSSSSSRSPSLPPSNHGDPRTRGRDGGKDTDPSDAKDGPFDGPGGLDPAGPSGLDPAGPGGAFGGPGLDPFGGTDPATGFNTGDVGGINPLTGEPLGVESTGTDPFGGDPFGGDPAGGGATDGLKSDLLTETSGAGSNPFDVGTLDDIWGDNQADGLDTEDTSGDDPAGGGFGEDSPFGDLVSDETGADDTEVEDEGTDPFAAEGGASHGAEGGGGGDAGGSGGGAGAFDGVGGDPGTGDGGSGPAAQDEPGELGDDPAGDDGPFSQDGSPISEALGDNATDPADLGNDPDRIVEVDGEPVEFVNDKAADLAESILDPATDTSETPFRELASQHGFDVPPDGNDVGHAVSPSQMQPGDVIASDDGKFYLYVGGEQAIDPTTGEMHDVSDVAHFSGENQGIFRLDPGDGSVAPIGGSEGAEASMTDSTLTSDSPGTADNAPVTDIGTENAAPDQADDPSGDQPAEARRDDTAPVGMGAGQNAPGGIDAPTDDPGSGSADNAGGDNESAGGLSEVPYQGAPLDGSEPVDDHAPVAESGTDTADSAQPVGPQPPSENGPDTSDASTETPVEIGGMVGAQEVSPDEIGTDIGGSVESAGPQTGPETGSGLPDGSRLPGGALDPSVVQ